MAKYGHISCDYIISFTFMSYTNVVFKQHIARNVNRDEIEHQRIDDRSTTHVMQLASKHASRQQEPSSITHQNSPLSMSQVPPFSPRPGKVQ